MPRIYISPSSQEENQGLSPFKTEEVEMNRIADMLVPLLVKDGRFTVKRNTPSMNVYEMAEDSNNFNASIHIAIHSNAGGGVGTEVYTYGKNTNSEKLGKSLYDQVAPLSPGGDRGVKYNPALIEVGNLVNATSVLIELAFHDDLKDATWIAYNHETIAKRLYMGVCDYLGYSYEALIIAPVATLSVASAQDHDVYLSVRVLDSKADALVKQIIGLGYATMRMPLA